MNPRIVLLAFSFIALATVAQAGTPTPVTPAGMGCVLVDDDGCSTGPWVSPVGAYAFGSSGSFTGTTSATVSSGATARTLTCSGVMVGVAMTQGGCSEFGTFPPANVPITLTCSSMGVGTIACSVEGS